MKKTKGIISILLACILLFSLAACEIGTAANTGNSSNNNNSQVLPEPPEYTLSLAVSSLGANWNPHTWESSSDGMVLDYITSPLVAISIKDSEKGTYQWVYEMAESVMDVSKDHPEDLIKYGILSLQAGQETIPSEEIPSGCVYEIKLNKNAKWANGEPITADDYIYSMQQLLDPKLQNYRANQYISGNCEIVGAKNYRNIGKPLYVCLSRLPNLQSFNYEMAIAQGQVFINMSTSDYDMYSLSLEDLNKEFEAGFEEQIEAFKNDADIYGYTQITAENRAAAENLIRGLVSKTFGVNDVGRQNQAITEALFVLTQTGEDVSFDTVGLYNADDYTLRYVCAAPVPENDFLTSLTNNWLVYRDYYEASRDESGEIHSSIYGTSMDNTMSYGPYMFEAIEQGAGMILVQNPNWYGWEEQEDGSLISTTNFEIDGTKKQQYQTTRIVIRAMDEAAAKNAFLAGELSSWTPSNEDIAEYSDSDRLYKNIETYTWSLFFNTNLAMLKNMDESKGNTNSVVLSNINFRKAFSLAIDRGEFADLDHEFEPSFTLMNNQYYYDVYNNPASVYRDSEQAKSAISSLYEKDYDAIDGKDIEKARELMKTACDELVSAGLYTAEEPIHIKMAYKREVLSSSDQERIKLLNEYINRAAEGSGFGEITLEGVGEVENRFADVPAGEYAVGCGSWGGAALYPFTVMQVYCDPDKYDINEAADWDPRTETLAMNVGEIPYIMTWKAWSNSIDVGGEFYGADFETKLLITATMEKEFLAKYYRVPVASYVQSEILSHRQRYYTGKYNILYGFGGFRLMEYEMDDAAWAEFTAQMASQNAQEKSE